MFDSLTKSLGQVFSKLKGRGVLSEDMVDEALREVKIALLEADVALPVVKSFMEFIKERAVGQDIIRSVQPAQQVIKIVNDALIEKLGADNTELAIESVSPSVYVLAGLQGAGKTTSCAKLARYLKKQGKKVLMASADIYRPAAQLQLQQLADAAQIDCLPVIEGQKPLQIAQRAVQTARQNAMDVVLIDTAGRLHIDEDMMQEIEQLVKEVKATETLLVLDALTGQDAVHIAEQFGARLPLTGLILTRVDGDARGGAALSMRQMTGQPIKFLGVGEKTDALEPFDAKRIAGRILDMGDVVGLVETAMEKINAEEAQKQAERMMSGRFDMNDMLAQLRQIKGLGDVKGIMMMIPGMAKFKDKIEQANIDNSIFKRQEAIILSMTEKERRCPELLKASRKLRIAKGAGVTVNDVNRLLKQYEQMAQAMKQFKKMGPLGAMRMMKQMSSAMKGNPLMNGGGWPPLKH